MEPNTAGCAPGTSSSLTSSSPESFSHSAVASAESLTGSGSKPPALTDGMLTSRSSPSRISPNADSIFRRRSPGLKSAGKFQPSYRPPGAAVINIKRLVTGSPVSTGKDRPHNVGQGAAQRFTGQKHTLRPRTSAWRDQAGARQPIP